MESLKNSMFTVYPSAQKPGRREVQVGKSLGGKAGIRAGQEGKQRTLVRTHLLHVGTSHVIRYKVIPVHAILLRWNRSIKFVIFLVLIYYVFM